jgi:hypothetical protein
MIKHKLKCLLWYTEKCEDLTAAQFLKSFSYGAIHHFLFAEWLIFALIFYGARMTLVGKGRCFFSRVGLL